MSIKIEKLYFVPERSYPDKRTVYEQEIELSDSLVSKLIIYINQLNQPEKAYETISKSS